jgi:hypothetical protein
MMETNARCGVNRVALTVGRPLPNYPDKQTFSVSASMSQRCQQRKSFLSVNDLVSAQQDCFGDSHSEGFRDLEVHDQLEPRWALNG